MLALSFEACWFGVLSQQPIRPHLAHLRRCSHHPPVAKQSKQPVPVGFAVELRLSLKLLGLSCLICTQPSCLLNLDFDTISIDSSFIGCLIIGLDVRHKLSHIFEKFLPISW